MLDAPHGAESIPVGRVDLRHGFAILLLFRRALAVRPWPRYLDLEEQVQFHRNASPKEIVGIN
jgi:hypothetical protein